MSKGLEVSVQAPVNIALIKYWGKRNEELMLPLNDSISVNIDELFATTKVVLGPHIKEDEIIVNGKKLEKKDRFKRLFHEFHKVVGRKRDARGELLLSSWHIKVESKTNFPTSAGLASSAAGFAAIAFGLGQLFNLDEREIIRLARLGSGSACRSILGGLVHWKMGQMDKDDSDCICETIAPISHWPELYAVILVVNESEKKVPSSEAMRNSCATSELMEKRVKEIVPKRVNSLKEAILTKNFPKMAEITMAESNQLHAICLDTSPPIIYLNSTSHALMDFVHSFNAHFGIRVAYTFDAGPNCCLLLEQQTLPLFESAFKQSFIFNCQFPEIASNVTGEFVPWPNPRQIQLERIIVSKVGMGPRVLDFCCTSAEAKSNEKDGVKEADHPKTPSTEREATILVDC